jgi:hypothetical protein
MGDFTVEVPLMDVSAGDTIRITKDADFFDQSEN